MLRCSRGGIPKQEEEEEDEEEGYLLSLSMVMYLSMCVVGSR
jgi:hypothetical protein